MRTKSVYPLFAAWSWSLKRKVRERTQELRQSNKALRESQLFLQTIIDSLPNNPERSVALRKLLEAKDAAVRAKLCGPVS